MFKSFAVLPVLFVALGISGCAQMDAVEEAEYPNPSEAGAAPQAGVICPSDYKMKRAVQKGPFANLPACTTAQTAATPCTAYAGPDAACTAYCAANWWSCIGAARNPAETAHTCFDKPDTNFYYMCVEEADCHCV